MAEGQQDQGADKDGGTGGGQQAKPPKTQRKSIPYVVFAAEGSPNAEPDGLNFEPVGRVTALTQSDAKKAMLEKSERLQSLLKEGSLWLEAVAERNWDPQPVKVKQPPPVLEGL